MFLPAQALQKAQLHYLVQVRVHAVEQARLVAGLRQKQPHLLGDLIAPDHQPGFAAGGVEFGQLLAQ